MSKKIIILIDGGYLRVKAKKARKIYNPDFIENFAHKCREQGEDIFRVLYYDCAMYKGTVSLPISGNTYTFTSNDKWLDDLARKDLFAVRRGVLKFRGYKPKQTPVNPAGPPTDADFAADFEQKGVDMRIGLDIASYCVNKCIRNYAFDKPMKAYFLELIVNSVYSTIKTGTPKSNTLQSTGFSSHSFFHSLRNACQSLFMRNILLR